MTKHTIDFGFDSQMLKLKKDMKTIQLKNFFLKPPNELVKLGYLPPVVRSISPPIKMSQAEHRYIVLVERKPVVEALRASWEVDRYGEREETAINLPLPWQHYFVILTTSTFLPMSTKTMALYFSQSSLSSLDHKFYTPYLPNVYTSELLHDHTLALPVDRSNGCDCGDDECGTLLSIENLCFPAPKHQISEGGFSAVFDQLYSIYWHGSKFNADLYSGPIDFIAKYDQDYLLNHSNKELERKMISCLERTAKVSFDTILSDDVFNCLSQVFTFSDYLKAVSNSATQELFDFKSLFEQGLDAGKVIDAVEQEYKPFQINKGINLTGVHQGNDGKWRRSNGKFASYDEIAAVRGVLMSLKIVYDDRAETLEFIKDDFSVCTAGVEAFNSVYSKNFSKLQTAFLPPAIRYIARQGDKTFVFYEERPQYHQVQFTPEKLEVLNLDAEGVYNYYLPFPWLMFIIELSPGNDITNIFGYIEKPRKKFFDTHLYQIPIHNWYANNILCRPMYNNESIIKHVDLLSVINQVHNEVWTSGFNNDLRDTVDNYALRMEDFGDKSFLTEAQRKTLQMLRNGDRDLFYNFYYTAWANTSIEGMIKASYAAAGTIGAMYAHLFQENETVLDRNQFVSELLMAAQYASFIK